ncbi:MAG: peptidase [Gammaproteobacteria bacterium]|nr:peptidase [Gammaproteobacteria bacterium]NVK86969.1 peptidase [Gammaproteobacteria bacterium]
MKVWTSVATLFLGVALVLSTAPLTVSAQVLSLQQKDILQGPYRDDITPIADIVGHAPGARVIAPEKIVQALTLWSQQSQRLQVVEYAKTHEGRPLLAVFIAMPERLAQLEDIKARVQQLANPVNLSQAQANALIDQLPAIAWLAYSIHGNESSGADAALLTIYHLIASSDPEVSQLLEQQLIIIDPMMNPDGRARFAKQLQENRGLAVNLDDQSLLHTGSWPYGRTNHYFFDLNRDFIYTTQPETKGRVALINQWYPQLMVDGHEMGAQDTYLFAPAREPINPHLPLRRRHWGKVFAADQAQAFDRNGWRYYTGEWFENLYPGYSNYAEYRGAVHILYEQARIAEDGVARPDGTIMSYSESVAHQFVSTMANLKTLGQHSKTLYREFVQERRENISRTGRYANRAFVVLPNENHSRVAEFVAMLERQNITVHRLTQTQQVTAIDQYGVTQQKYSLPKNSIVILNRQPEARLLATMLEFDVAIKPEVLQEERHRTLRDGSSLMYDSTAWNLTMMLGLPAVTVDDFNSSHLQKWQAATPIVDAYNPQAVAYAIDGQDDNILGFTAQLLEQGVQLRAIDKATELGAVKLSRGSVILTFTDNPQREQAYKIAAATAAKFSLSLHAVTTGHGLGDLPDWGGQHFPLLKRPVIATLSQRGFSPYDVGATWYVLDHRLGIRHSIIDANAFNFADLRRYNVLILPDQYADSLSPEAYQKIKAWVAQGGTLIAFANAASALIENDISSAAELPDALQDASDFDAQLQREWMALNVPTDLSETQISGVASSIVYPWSMNDEAPSAEELQKRDDWLSVFMPSGAFLATRSDEKHWLSFGSEQSVPVLMADHPVLMAKDQVAAVTRLGHWQVKANTKLQQSADEKSALRYQWSSVPTNVDVQLRMSGLLWPEASQRLVNGVYLAQESSGRGQVILFANSPNFRGASLATSRLFLNAVVFGPGLGTGLVVGL